MTKKTAEELHKNVPPNWYHQSIKENIFQRFWHNKRFSEVKKLIEPTKGSVLDIGCADGVFTNVILKTSKADQIIGIDVLKSSIKWAKNHWKRAKKMKFKIGDAHKLYFKPNTFSAVFALEVLEHVHNPEIILKEIYRVLKKRGYIILLVPTDNLLFRFIWFLWTKHRGSIWDDCHIQSYKASSLNKLVEKADFKIEKEKLFLLGMLKIIKARK